MELLKLVLCSLFLNFVCCRTETYKAAVVDTSGADIVSSDYASLVNEAAKSNVDLLVLPNPKCASSELSLESCADVLEDFSGVLNSISVATKEARIYVVAPLFEKWRHQNKEELLRTTSVFNRRGQIILTSSQKTPVSGFTKCNRTSSKIDSFTTVFGVPFGVLPEEDLVLRDIQKAEDIKNFIVTHSSLSNGSFLFAKQFPSSWAFVNNANLIFSGGYFGARDNSRRISRLIVAELEKSGSDQLSITAGPTSSFPSESLSQYAVKPLDVEASLQGYSESVCHGKFCCQFYVKTNVNGANRQDGNYGFIAFNGIHQMDSENIGIQLCSLTACAGVYKRSCFIGSENTTNIKFNTVTISANFSSEKSAQFPIISTTTQTIVNKENLQFIIDNKCIKHVTAELNNCENVLAFGIFGRDYSKDFEIGSVNNTESSVSDFSDYVSSENELQEFFDYLWIRLRVVIFIVSVYILEMM